jgi:hypothetical protein
VTYRISEGTGAINRPGIQRQLRVQNTALDHELLQKELKAIRAVHVIHEENAFALDELELENNVGEEEFVHF